jgi:signal transduction histidine kinase
VILSLKDDGPGIPASVLKRLGERGNTSGKTSGTGLGLAHAIETTKNLVGTFDISAPECGGTLVQVKFPRNP